MKFEKLGKRKIIQKKKLVPRSASPPKDLGTRLGNNNIENKLEKSWK